MHSKFHLSSGPFCRREQCGSIEKNAENIIVIRDKPTIAHLKTLFWITMGAILLIAALGAITSQNVLAVSILVLVLLASISFIARLIITEIDLAERTIRRTWKIGTLAWHRVYSLENYATAEIKVKGQVIEGYSLLFFSVYLVGTGRHMTIYSTDDAKDATAVYGAITSFLDGARISKQQQQAG